MTQDSNGKVTTSQLDIIYESQEVKIQKTLFKVGIQSQNQATTKLAVHSNETS